MNKVQIFNSDRFGQVRVQMDTSGEPLFCASDVCTALGYALARKAVQDHVDAEDVTKRNTPTNGGIQEMLYINESGLYSLIFGSKTWNSKAIQKMKKLFAYTRKVSTFAVLTDRQTQLSRRASVNCSIVIGHYLCPITKDIRRLPIRSHRFVLRDKVCRTVSSVYGDRFSCCL